MMQLAQRKHAIMKRAKPSANPARIQDMLTEEHYRGWGLWTSLKQERDKCVASLRKKLPNNNRAEKLADRLEACRPNARCGSGACPICLHFTRNLFAETARAFLDQHAGNAQIVIVSIAPADGTCAVLSKAQHERNMRRWKDKLSRAGAGTASSERSTIRSMSTSPRTSVPLVRALFRDHTHQRSGEAQGKIAATVSENRCDSEASDDNELGWRDCRPSLRPEIAVLATDRPG